MPTFGVLHEPLMFNLFTKNILLEGISRLAGPCSSHTPCHAFAIAYNQLEHIWLRITSWLETKKKILQ